MHTLTVKIDVLLTFFIEFAIAHYIEPFWDSTTENLVLYNEALDDIDYENFIEIFNQEQGMVLIESFLIM